ncbi:hypothetical protein D9M71_721260 [compost metagenome]
MEEYRPRFTALLQRALGFAGQQRRRVLVLSIPDWGVTPFARENKRDPAQIERELDAYNATAQAICAEHAVAFVDITAISRERGAEPGMLVEDGLHPSAAMYTEWTRRAFPVVRAHLDDEAAR